MITKPVLRELINRCVKDAEVLFENRRYSSAVYMAGYAIEIAFKYKICRIYIFSKTFPKTKFEFRSYYSASGNKKNLRQAIKTIQEIRNHDLLKLLFYSGSEVKIKSKLLNEWNLIAGWNPEMRYKIIAIDKTEAQNKISAVKSILNEIL